MILGCIADDFTGATDLAALLVRAGVPVSLRIGLPDRPGIGPGEDAGETGSFHTEVIDIYREIAGCLEV